VEGDGAEDAERAPMVSLPNVIFLSVLMPTLAMPILRTSSSTPTTYLKSAPASLLMITFGSLAWT
jgi:hypothetical protein